MARHRFRWRLAMFDYLIFFFFLLHKHSSSSHTQNRQTSCPSGDGTWFTYSWWASMLWLTTSVLVLVGIITDLLVFLSLPSPVIRFGFFFSHPLFVCDEQHDYFFIYLINPSYAERVFFFSQMPSVWLHPCIGHDVEELTYATTRSIWGLLNVQLRMF